MAILEAVLANGGATWLVRHAGTLKPLPDGPCEPALAVPEARG